MKIMSVDLGKARTGLAISDSGEFLASPLYTISESDQNKLVLKILDAISEHKPQMLVVGLPKNMDGSEGESAQNARSFAEILKEQSGLPVEMCDERGTTITAHNYLNTTNTRGKKRKAVIDSVAATVILEDYLNYRRLHKDDKNRP